MVEGNDDKQALIHLIDHHVTWGNNKNEWPVRVDDCDGVDNLLEPAFLRVHLKSSEIRRLGIVIDANSKFESRWQSLQDRGSEVFLDFPKSLPEDGLIVQDAGGKRMGIWVMPDNRSSGMLEDFLSHLVPAASERLWKFAQDSAREAAALGAAYRESHSSKAAIHTWLAWADPPGQSLGTALLRRCLDPHAPMTSSFVAWFKKLFQLES